MLNINAPAVKENIETFKREYFDMTAPLEYLLIENKNNKNDTAKTSHNIGNNPTEKFVRK